MLAAGEQPDFGNWWGNPVEFYQDGVTRAIPKEWIREYAPNIAKLYDDYPLAWNTWENPGQPGRAAGAQRHLAETRTAT